MGLLKRNWVAVLGWLIFMSLYYLFVKLFSYGTLQMQAEFPAIEINPLTILALILLSIFLISFLAFVISLRIVAFLVIHRGKVKAADLKYPLFFEWVVFFIVFIIFTWPISYVQALLEFTSIPDTVIGAIAPIWQILVSFMLYRESVIEYLKKFKNQPKDAEEALIQEHA